MKQVYKSGAVPGVPAVDNSEGNPTEGDVARGIAATILGDYWPYMISKELEAVCLDHPDIANHPLDARNLTQVRDAIRAMIEAKVRAIQAPVQFVESGVYFWPFADGTARVTMRAAGGWGGPATTAGGLSGRRPGASANTTVTLEGITKTAGAGRNGSVLRGGSGGDAGAGDVQNVDGEPGADGTQGPSRGGAGGGTAGTAGAGAEGARQSQRVNGFFSGGGGGQGALVIFDVEVIRGQRFDIVIGAAGAPGTGSYTPFGGNPQGGVVMIGSPPG